MAKQDRFTILVHGGTVTRPDQVTGAQLDLIRRVVADARRALAAGAAALDAVVDAVVELEDSGLRDAGKGSHLNTAGFVENDAALMDGHTGRAGAVAAMQRVRNPIRAARIVMQETPHVLLVGSTGEAEVIRLGAEIVDDPAAYFVPYDRAEACSTGTVGAVALDMRGRLAAATSTGGTPDKLPGRVGDSPIIGAGTFANERLALSATGVGESFVRRCAAVDVAMRVQYRGVTLRDAADEVVVGSIGNIDHNAGAMIAIDRDGEIVVASNVHGVLHGSATESRSVRVGVRVSDTA